MTTEKAKALELAIGEGAGPTPAIEDGTGGTVAAVYPLVPGGTVAVFDIPSFFQDGDAQVGPLAQFQGGKDASRASANNQHVKAFVSHLISQWRRHFRRQDYASILTCQD